MGGGGEEVGGGKGGEIFIVADEGLKQVMRSG